MLTSAPRSLLVASLLLCPACDSDEEPTGDTEPTATCASLGCDESSPCVPRGSIAWAPKRLPNVLFVVDRSPTMGETVAIGEDEVAKPGVVRDLAGRVLPSIADSMKSGLMLVPAPHTAGCSTTDTPSLDLAYRTELGPLVVGHLDGAGVSTEPAALAGSLEAFARQMDCDFADPDRDAIFIVVSDGLGVCDATCDASDETCQATALRDATTCALAPTCCNVELYVVHVGPGDPPATLTAMAEASEAAGTPSPALYQALVPDTHERHVGGLVTRLHRVGAAFGGRCTFSLVLGGETITAEELLVSVNGYGVPECATGDCDEGWTLDGGSFAVTLMPDTCRLLDANPDCPDVRFDRR